MSVALTTDAVRGRRKTVTRRAGWQVLGPGDLITLCAKVRGRRAGEPLDRIVTVEVVSVRREALNAITADDVIAEGFPGMTPAEFVEFFCASHRGITPGSEISRIEWVYPAEDLAAGPGTGGAMTAERTATPSTADANPPRGPASDATTQRECL